MRRREFLSRGARLAALAAGAGALSLDRLVQEAAAQGPLRKCISMGGSGALRQDGDPDNYLLWGNREFVRDLSETRWVKLWVSWYDLQQELGFAPRSRAESWSHLNSAPGGQSWLRRLDRQVKAANDDGVGVILALYQANPTWATGATGPDPVRPSRPAEQKLPLDLTTNGPWGWFIAYLSARYSRGAAPNQSGPHDPAPGEPASGSDPRFGNPDGAAIDCLEICNEPNWLYWPQDGIVGATAQMIRSAAALSAIWGRTPLLAPATSDFPDGPRRDATVWSEFTPALLRELSGFNPAVPVRWSHHNYRDVRLAEWPSRAERVIAMLRESGWTSDGPLLWLTEGGLNLGSSVNDPAQREFQAQQIERNFRRMMTLPDVYMWTQHTISDKDGNSFKSGLRDDFSSGRGIGAPRPSWYVYKELPGSPVV